MKLIFLFYFLLSCSNNSNKSAAIPLPGRSQLVQFYMLESGARTDWIGFDSHKIANALGAHLSEFQAPNFEAAKAKLREWAPRPIDILVLGPGLNLEALKIKSLPKLNIKRIVSLNYSTPTLGVLNLSPDDKSIAAFSTWICTRAAVADCKVGGENAILELRVKWEELFQDILRKTSTGQAEKLVLDFASGYWNFAISPSLDATKRAKVDALIKDYALSNLRGAL
jgi:hypothetical protein